MQTFHSALLMAAAISLVTGAAEAHSSGGSAHSVGAAGVRSTLRSSVPGSGAPGMSLTMPRAQAPQSSAAPDPRASGPSSSSSGGGTLSAGPPQPPPSGSASPAPPSQVGQPAPQPPTVTPLSPQLSTQFATGGTPTNSNLALSPGSSSESAPSTPGGGGKTLQACMIFWEPATHMSKIEWRAACQRTMQDDPSVR
jgi:hypothetical protein